MKTFKQSQEIIYVDYHLYEALINKVFYEIPLPLNESSQIDVEIKKSLGKLKALFKDLKTYISPIVDELNIPLSDVVSGLKQKVFYEIFKLFGFNIKKMLKEIKSTNEKFKNELFKVFENLYKSKAFEKLEKGTITVDDIINNHPILNKITGLSLAAFLFYIWLSISVLNHLNLNFDFDFDVILQALKGNFSLADVFASPKGISMMSLFVTGNIFSVSLLATGGINIILAIIYVSYKKSGKAENKKLDKLKSLIKLN